MVFVYVYYVLLALSLVYGLYFSLTGLWAFLPRKKEVDPKKPDHKNRFAVIIAARNEAGVIGALIDSLHAQSYDPACFTVFVAVNHCTDNTADVARTHGAEVIDCPDSVRSKGDVLKIVFSRLQKEANFDAYAIFDADNIVHPDFLSEMNDVLNRGALVAQCRRDAKNLSDNWISTGYSLFYYLQNFFFNRARSRVGLSASINGTGFVVTRKALEKTGFNTHTMTEDVEYSAICALHGVKIEFVEKAITYDEQPTGFSDSLRQRHRWSAGNHQCCLRYFPSLIRGFWRTGWLSCLDMAFNFSAPILSVASIAVTLLPMIFSLCGVALNDLLAYVFSYGWVLFLVTYFCSIGICSIILRHNGRRADDCLPGLLLFTVFLFSWLPLNIAVLIKRNIRWKPIVHSRNIDLGALTKKTN